MVMILSEALPGMEINLKEINGGRGLRSKLYSMGLLPGTHLRVLCSNGGGPVIISLRDSRLALGRGMADKIIVEKAI
jgi:Fe2+ transport system protein FeoA